MFDKNRRRETRHDDAALIVSGTLEVGGSETKTVKIANALAKSGHDIALAYLNPPDTLLDKVDAGVRVVHLERRGKYSVSSLRKLVHLVNERYRTVVSVNFYPLLYAVPAIRVLAKQSGRVISLINTTDFVDRQWIFGPVYAPFIRRCDQVVFGCEAQKSMWITKYRLNVEHSQCIYNGVDSDHYSLAALPGEATSLRAEFDIPRDAIVVGSVGRLAPEKNFDLLIQAVARLHAEGRDAYLVLIGQGQQRERLEQVAMKFGIAGKVRFTGVLTDVRAAMAAMDIFVLPSRAVETFSNAALEAMAMERPVVLSKIGGASEMVENGVSGLLFDVGDIDALTGLLANLYDSGHRRHEIGVAARERVVRCFSFPDMVAEYEKLMFN